MTPIDPSLRDSSRPSQEDGAAGATDLRDKAQASQAGSELATRTHLLIAIESMLWNQVVRDRRYPLKRG